MLFALLLCQLLLWPSCSASPPGIRGNAMDHRIVPACQQVFELRMRTDYYMYGVLTVPSPPLSRVGVPLLVRFVLNARLPTVRTSTPSGSGMFPSQAHNFPNLCAFSQKYGGLLELRRSQDETLRNIRQRRPVQFIIHFPVQSPLPLLTLVLYDNDVLCGAAGA